MLFGVLRPKLGPAKIPRIRLFLHKNALALLGDHKLKKSMFFEFFLCKLNK